MIQGNFSPQNIQEEPPCTAENTLQGWLLLPDCKPLSWHLWFRKYCSSIKFFQTPPRSEPPVRQAMQSSWGRRDAHPAEPRDAQHSRSHGAKRLLRLKLAHAWSPARLRPDPAGPPIARASCPSPPAAEILQGSTHLGPRDTCH